MDKIEKIGFIINPISGTRTKENIPELIKEIIETNRFEPVISYTECAGHATKIAKQMVKEGYSIVVAVGGDGTINEIARSLIHTNVALGIVPCGSGNGLARHLGVPLDVRGALELVNNHKVVEIDYGTANNIIFFCTCGVGFDAHIGHQFAQSKTRGFFTYLKSILREFIKYRAKKYKFKTQGNKFSKKAFLVTFANASQYGNNAYIAPNADIQDGLLDVCILEPFPVYHALNIGVRLLSKKIEKSRFIEILQTNEVRIKRKKRDVFHFDGEPCIMKKKITVKSIPKGLKVAVAHSSALR
jgi:YegS/Rv2252/BmrU family lipid kinase